MKPRLHMRPRPCEQVHPVAGGPAVPLCCVYLHSAGLRLGPTAPRPRGRLVTLSSHQSHNGVNAIKTESLKFCKVSFFILSDLIQSLGEACPQKNSQNFNVPVQIYKLDPFLDFFGRLPCSIYWKLFKRIWQKTKLLDFHVQWFIYSHRGNIRISEWQRVHVTKQNTLLFTNSVSAIKDFPTNIRPLLCQLEICFEPGSSEKGVLNMRFCLIWSSQTRVNSEGRLRRLEYFSEEPRPGHGLDLWCWTGVTALAAALLSGEAELQPLNR